MRPGIAPPLTQFVAALALFCFVPAAQALERLDVDGGHFLIDWRGEFTSGQQARMKGWLKELDACLSLLHGSWPRPQIRIAFKPYNSDSPVPFARILRNSPEGVLFYVNPDKPLADLIADWTAYHELAHLFIPYPGRPGAWFSEGLASYYQNILQVRSGVITPGEARDRLAAAFKRGREDSGHSDLTLGELSRDMMKRRAFMRVYWSGALYFLEADIALRSRPVQDGVPANLDEVLRDFDACCLEDGVSMDARAIATEFDRLAATDIFVTLFDRYEESTAIPAYEELLGSSIAGEIFAVPAT